MDIPKAELFSVLQEFNPWWSGQPVADLPDWERAASRQLREWIDDDQTKRSLLLTGARQVGKTTLFRQAIRRLDFGARRRWVRFHAHCCCVNYGSGWCSEFIYVIDA
jgi:hypothetical protein